MNKLRRADPKKIQFRDLMSGDQVIHNSRPLTVIGPRGGDTGELMLQYTDAAGGRVNWGAIGNNSLLGSSSVTFVAAAPGAPSVPSRLKDKFFDSVILPAHKKQEITDAISQVDNHDLIFNQWGFSDVFEKGTAISLLFYGLPGTGKTLMAQAIADRYGRQLLTISTAEVETPEPGGAERNLKKFFEQAQKEEKVLLFDECDSLITDRGRVGMILAAQINALLTELERYTGIVIFTTNRLGALDAAFERRLSLKLEFEMPSVAERVKIWKRMFPKKAPVAKNVRWGDLAQVEIAGGHIKNVVLKAARRAAAAQHTEITDDVIWEALEKEVESMDAYTSAMNAHNPWYGTPIKGGLGGGGLEMVRSSGNKTKREITRG